MNLNYKELLPPDFAADSRVWIYQSDRLFAMSEVLQIEDMLNEFVKEWNSHGTPVKGFATVFFGQFIILMADETASGVSGCSTDSSVRLIKEIEKKFSVNLFDRQLLAFIIKDKIQLLPLSQLNYAVENNFIDGSTPYFNNTVKDKNELENNWIIPVKESWLSKKINLQKDNSVYKN
ncbi:MAG TPA: hypothetical protein VHZ50_12690 [Puia sp.]|jgi:hypothetical protein|nr:hypothetical protein [Puia sp.]